MQNDPKDIPRLVDELERSGSDMVNGWRNQRQDPFFKKFFRDSFGYQKNFPWDTTS